MDPPGVHARATHGRGRLMTPRPPLVLIPQFFGSLVFDRRTSRYLPFDAEATAVLTSLLGAPIGHVLEDATDAAHRERIERFFEHFYELGFFTLDERLAAVALDLDPPAGHLVAPLAVH